MSITRSLRYGAAELKRLYNRNLGLALVISVGVHFALILLYLFVASLQAGEDHDRPSDSGGPTVIFPPIAPPETRDIEPPKPMIPDPIITDGRGGSPAVADEKAGRVRSVDDALVNDSTKFATFDHLAFTLAQPNDAPGGGGFGNGDDSGAIGIGGPVSVPKGTFEKSEEIPPSTVFIATEEDPTFDSEDLYRRLQYPHLARINGIEGRVVVQVYVDKHGRPVRTEIAQSSNKLLEDAAVEAIMETRFTPAIQNDAPIGVWIAIPVLFQLK